MIEMLPVNIPYHCVLLTQWMSSMLLEMNLKLYTMQCFTSPWWKILIHHAPSNSTFCLLATVVNIVFPKQMSLQDYTNSGEGNKVGSRDNVFIL